MAHLNRKLQIAVGTARLQPRAPDLRGHQTSTAGSGSQNGHRRTSSASATLPDPNPEREISAGTAGPQPRAPDLSGHCENAPARIEISTARSGSAHARKNGRINAINASIDARKNARMNAR